VAAVKNHLSAVTSFAVLWRCVSGVLALLSVIVLPACGHARTPCVYEIPSGYTGWVLIEFERPDAPPLPKRDGKLIFHVGGDGHMATSSKCEFGWSHDEYFYVGTTPIELERTAWGGGGQIWAGSNGSTQTAGQRPRTYETFFVGSEAAFKNAGIEPQP
jgi:hypothetical protein